LHIVTDDGDEGGPNQTGVIYFSGGRQFEYYNDALKTASVHNERGWNTLGDVGHVDSDGYLYITDREADVVISGAVNIYPREVEEVLLQHPDVDDVAVIGVPNEEFGEEVKAIVKPRAGVVVGPDFEANLIAECRQHLARYKCPRSVDIVDELPRKDTGKLYKRILRERYWSDTPRTQS
jgi:acyl-CoA synthetase (AMP-forming)/AMP-acid ligase II